MRVLAFSMGLVLAASTPAWADPATGEQGEAAKDAAKQRVVCKRSTKANSRIATRECLTLAQWEERAETARKAFQEVQDRPQFEIRRGD